MDPEGVSTGIATTVTQREKDKIHQTDATHVEESNDGEKVVSGIEQHLAREKTAAEAAAEKRFVLKTDLIILPLLTSMYFLASLDRGDIGYAAVAGMAKELRLSPSQLSTCITIFYVGYIVFQVPGYLCLRIIRPPLQLGLALIFWGLFTTLICIAKTYQQVAGLRVGVGVGEAFLQAAPLYLSLWYKREQLATRGAIFFAMSAIAGAFNGIIAYGITKHLNGAGGRAAWQWIFLIEGIISVAWGFVVFIALPGLPEKIKYGFTEQEKEIAKRRTTEAYNVPHARVQPKQLLEVFKERRFYLYVVFYCCNNSSLACFSGFLPVILRSYGYSTLHTQLLTVPVFGAAAVSIVVTCIASDRLKKRAPILLACFSSAAIGWLILLVSKNRKLSFAGCFFIGIGTYPSIVITQTWLNNNTPGFTRRAMALGAMGSLGQTFSIIGTEVYSDPPYYYRGNGFAFGVTILGVLAIIALWYDLKRENARKLRETNSEWAVSQRHLGIEDIGNKHPDFMYFT